jgi:hypothetical protein
MQHEIHFDEQAGVIFVRYREHLNVDIILAASKAVNALPGLWPGIPVFVDFRRCVEIDLSTDDTRRIADFMASHEEQRGNFRIAQLVSSKLMYGVSRMSAATIDEDKMQIMSFEDVAPALEWIGLPADYPLPFKADVE